MSRGRAESLEKSGCADREKPPSSIHLQVHERLLSSSSNHVQTTDGIYRSLDEKINSVATKVVHLGDQLESVNTPRARDVEALKLMKHLNEFIRGETNLSPVFNDK